MSRLSGIGDIAAILMSVPITAVESLRVVRGRRSRGGRSVEVREGTCERMPCAGSRSRRSSHTGVRRTSLPGRGSLPAREQALVIRFGGASGVSGDMPAPSVREGPDGWLRRGEHSGGLPSWSLTVSCRAGQPPGLCRATHSAHRQRHGPGRPPAERHPLPDEEGIHDDSERRLCSPLSVAPFSIAGGAARSRISRRRASPYGGNFSLARRRARRRGAGELKGACATACRPIRRRGDRIPGLPPASRPWRSRSHRSESSLSVRHPP